MHDINPESSIIWMKPFWQIHADWSTSPVLSVIEFSGQLVQSPALLPPVLGAKVLIGQFSGKPPTEKVPAKEGTQSSCEAAPTVTRTVPLEHGVGEVAPSRQYPPTGHSSHCGWPRAGWYLPAGQSGHSGVPVLFAKEPAEQSVGSVAPLAAYIPRYAGTHPLSVRLRNHPGSQGLIVVPSEQ